MSTVLWYKGTMYSDSRITVSSFGNPDKIITGKKMFRVDNTIYGVTGTIEGFTEFASREYKGSWRWNIRKFDFALILQWNGEKLISWSLRQRKFFGIYFSWYEMEEFDWQKNPNLFLYMGSGGDYANEANKKGLNFEEMIQYASDRDSGTNDIMVSMEL